GIFINQILAKKFPTRTLESIKSRRKTKEYRELLQQLRDCRESQNIEGSECTDESADVNSDIVENDDVINNNNNNDEDFDDNNPNDIVTTTVRGTDGTTYRNVQQYIKDKIIDGRVQMCTTMADALSHYVEDVLYSDPVEESLNGICEALESV
ncbi:unnamed protein product, partial [Rotaria magnacalcarata]